MVSELRNVRVACRSFARNGLRRGKFPSSDMTSLSSRARIRTRIQRNEIIPSSFSPACEEAVWVSGGNRDLGECVMQNFVHAIRQGLAGCGARCSSERTRLMVMNFREARPPGMIS